jgi:CRP-like cAMP-binding protein
MDVGPYLLFLILNLIPAPRMVSGMSNPMAELKEAAILNTLRGCRLFAGLPPENLREIIVFTTLRSLDKGEYLFHQSQPSLGFYIVQKGAINVHRVNAAGKEHVIYVFRAGESFAEGTLATESGYPGDARAVESSLVLQVQKPGFIALLRKRPELALRMLGSMSMHLRTLVGQLEDLTLKDVETRLANWLIKRCPDPCSSEPYTIELTVTKRVLAAELGTVSETFSRTIAKLREQNLVDVKGKAITVCNPALLHILLKKHLGE